LGQKLPWRIVAEWITEGEACIRSVEKVYAAGATKFQEYLIGELAGIGKSLVLDGKVQSSLFDEHWYHEALVHPIMIAHECPKNVLIIGGGEGATAREVLKHKCVEQVVMVDIDAELIELAKKYLPEWHQGAFDNEKLKLVLDDGRKFLSATDMKFDIVILDLVDPMEGGPAALLYTLEFYRLVSRVLKPGGAMVTQASSPILTPRVYATIRNTIASVFNITRPYITYVRSYNGVWGFVAASNSIDPSNLSPDTVDKLIKERIRGELRFYDGITHQWMFTLPKPIRSILDSHNDVATDSNPIYVPV